jgi:hypothetical protein
MSAYKLDMSVMKPIFKLSVWAAAGKAAAHKADNNR